jgi:hypothetical protein
LEKENKEQPEALVLVASLDAGTSLYAIERVKPRVYALCKLCAWVHVGYIEDGSAAAIRHIPSVDRKNNSGKWWDAAVVNQQNEASAIPGKRLKLSMTPPAAQGDTVAAEVTKAPAASGALPTCDMPPLVDEADLAPPIDTPKPDEEVFETLIRHYLEALYVSKTSLAFFVKGPLSRARNIFLSATNAGAIVGFTAQIRTMLLSMPAMDKKYREKLPEVIKGFPLQSLSDDENEAPFPTKKRRSKKVPKLSREGYYPIEDDYCRRWWLNNQSTTARARPDETFEQLLRRRVGDLRRRETLAQIILILEILALEASPEFKTPQRQFENSQDVEAPAEKAMEGRAAKNDDLGAQRKPKRNAKKQQDVDLLLDLLLDKLSIWQSIEQDLSAAIDVDKKRDSLAENNEKLQDHDMLVGFCTDVVIPFYKSRIPNQASRVNKKLGGPGAVSPVKPGKVNGRANEKSTRKNGDRRPRIGLQKTLSDTNGFIRSKAPSLPRSATDTQSIPRLKREANELSLLDIPLARPSHRDSLSQLRHLQQRQVDLTAISAATDAKLRQKAKIEQDLKDAIDTLKRPNRGQAVKELADAADQRSLGSASMRKKTMGPVRKVLQNVRNVQVTATPRHRRTFNALAPPKLERDEEAEEQRAPSSGDYFISSSGYRSSKVDKIGATPAACRLKPVDGTLEVSATPSRNNFQRLADDELLSDHIGITPSRETASTLKPKLSKEAKPGAQQCLSFQDFMRSQMSNKKATATPLKSTTEKLTLHANSATPASIFATPSKRASVVQNAMPENTPLKAATTTPLANSDAEEPSLYDALGWNDYDDEIA